MQAPEASRASAVAVFHARSLAKTYVVGEILVRALHDVDLELFAGEFIVVLGPSGSGKSTLLNILASSAASTFRPAVRSISANINSPARRNANSRDTGASTSASSSNSTI